MQIVDMNQIEIKQVIETASVGRLACTHEGQPYIVPLNFAHYEGALYAFTTYGHKVECMRANPRVCVEFDHVSATNDWQSVIVTGLYEELNRDPDTNDARNDAYRLLSNRAQWWEPAYVKTVIRGRTRGLQPVYFRILISEVTGHKAIR